MTNFKRLASTFVFTTLSITAASVPALLFMADRAYATLVTNPEDPRSWQGATVGTFAALYYGANTAENRQKVIDNKLLDDGVFDFSGATPASMIKTTNALSTGRSLDMTGTGSYGYVQPGGTPEFAGSGIDEYWVQTSGVLGDNVWDLGALSNKAAIFNTIDHGPLPNEAIESTVYLSLDGTTWTQAVTERVWLEGFMTNTGILWDGFAYAVGTGDNSQFRYASIIHGGPGALQHDGDNEINGVLGLDVDFHPTSPVPLPAALPLLATALGALGFAGWRRRKADY